MVFVHFQAFGGQDRDSGLPRSSLWSLVPLEAFHLLCFAQQQVHKRVIDTLLKPRQWTPPTDRHFFLSAEEISELCEDAENLFKKEPTVLSLQGVLGAVFKHPEVQSAWFLESV